MNCKCGGEYHEAIQPRTLRFQGRRVTVEATVLACGGCGDVLFTPEQAEALQARASREVRENEGLLQPAEVRALRQALGLTQRQFEELLGVGHKTVARWEGGTVFQSKAADNLMRLVRDVPGAARALAVRNGITLRAAAPAPAAPRQRRTA